jgi:hypothetical protein
VGLAVVVVLVIEVLRGIVTEGSGLGWDLVVPANVVTDPALAASPC